MPEESSMSVGSLSGSGTSTAASTASTQVRQKSPASYWQKSPETAKNALWKALCRANELF